MPNFNTPHTHITDPFHEEVEAILRGYVEKNPMTRFCAYIHNGKLCPEKVTEGGLSGVITGRGARNLYLRSDIEQLNAIYIGGPETDYEIDGLDFDLKGHGCNDFSGVGAAICVEDGAKLRLRNARVVTRGAIRPTIRTGGGAEMHAYRCEFIAKGGGLTPETFTPPEDTGVWFPPAPLNLEGDCRATLTLDGGKSYYDDCTIICDKWGALATDCALGYVYLEANDCKVISEGNGYITYADDDTHVILNRCEMKSGTVCGIQAGESDMAFYDCTADCGSHFVMIHEVLNDYQTIGLCRIVGCKIHCGGPVIYIREASCDVYVADCELHADNGVLVHMVRSDDPNVTKLRDDEVSFGAQITFDSMKMQGNLINDIRERELIVKLSATELRGALDNVNVQLLGGSHWFATADSSVVLTGDMTEGTIDAAEGVVIHATAGKDCPLRGESRLPSGGLLRVSE